MGDDLDRDVAALDQVDRVLRATGLGPRRRFASVPAGVAAVVSPVVASLMVSSPSSSPASSAELQAASASAPAASSAPVTRNLVFM